MNRRGNGTGGGRTPRGAPWQVLLFSLCMGAAAMPSAHAQSAETVEIGNVEMGARLAEDVCAQCHAVSPDDDLSPNMNAPGFQSIAERPEMTALALGVWFRSPHQTMPNFVLSPDETADLIAYIFSLRNDAPDR